MVTPPGAALEAARREIGPREGHEYAYRAFLAGWAARSSSGSETGEAVHASVQNGERTLCGQDGGPLHTLSVAGYPDHDEGGAYCWTCLEVRDELRAALSSPPVEAAKTHGYPLLERAPAVIELAARAVRHELDQVEALTDYSDRGADEICRDVACAVLDAVEAST